MPAVVPLSLEEQGLRFFFDRFVSAMSGLDGNAPSGLQTPPFLKAILMQSPLRDATISVGLAAMANVNQDRALSLAAREMYVAAINFVRRAVQNPERANANQTFHIIVMLSMYEVRVPAHKVSCDASSSPLGACKADKIMLDGVLRAQ